MYLKFSLTDFRKSKLCIAEPVSSRVQSDIIAPPRGHLKWACVGLFGCTCNTQLFAMKDFILYTTPLSLVWILKDIFQMQKISIWCIIFDSRFDKSSRFFFPWSVIINTYTYIRLFSRARLNNCCPSWVSICKCNVMVIHKTQLTHLVTLLCPAGKALKWMQWCTSWETRWVTRM